MPSAYWSSASYLRRPPDRSGGRIDPGEHADEQRIFEGVVDLAIPFFQALPDQVHLVKIAKRLVDAADPLTLDILGGRSLDDVHADPAIEPAHEPGLQRPLDVAEQDDARHIGVVVDVMDEGFVEQ